MKKKLVIAVISVICIFSIFIVEECIRLKINNNSKPLIVLNATEKYSNDSKQLDVTYYSLGFRTEMKYYLDDNSSEDNHMYALVGKEFYLFNVIMLWAWIV